MAKSFLVPINMNGLEIQNFLAHNLASAPTGVKGKLYFNTTDNKLYYHNGSAWVPLTANTNIPKTTTTPKMDGTAAIGSETKYAAGDHVHPTDTSRAPNNHASSATTYGVGTSSNYGHVKLSDSADSGSIDASKGTAATPKAVSTAFSSACEYTDEEIAGLNLGAASQKGVDTTVSSSSANLPTSAAVATYVSGQIGAVDAMRFKGTLGTGGTITALPTSGVKVGDTYRVITAGTYASIVCEVGDLIIATATTPTWTVAQTNIDGAVTASTTTTNGYLAKFTGNKVVANGPALGSSTTTYLRNDGSWATPTDTDTKNTAGSTDTSSKIFLIGATSQAANPQTYSHDTAYVGTDGCLYSGGTKVLTAHRTYTAVTGKPTADQTPSWGDSFTISQISQSTTGQITATDKLVYIPSAAVSTTRNGLATPDMLSAIQDIPTYTTLTIAAGQTSVSTNKTVRSYIAYDASTYEEVVVDLLYGANSRTFSIASAYTNVIEILIWG